MPSILARVLVFVFLTGSLAEVSAAPAVSAGGFRRTLKAMVGNRTGREAAKEAARYLERTLRDPSNKVAVTAYANAMARIHRQGRVRLRPEESFLFTQRLLNGYLDGKKFSSSDRRFKIGLLMILAAVDRSHSTLDHARRAQAFVVARLERLGVPPEERTVFGWFVLQNLARRFGYFGDHGEL